MVQRETASALQATIGSLIELDVAHLDDSIAETPAPTFARSHAERCLAYRENGGGLAVELDLGNGSSPEEKQQELAWRSYEASGRLASPCLHSFVCSGPLELESGAAEASS
jgi:hypothetical protein